MLVLYPERELRQQLDGKIWDQALESWAKVLGLWLEQRDSGMVDEVIEFSNSYVHEKAKEEVIVVSNELEKRLRSAVIEVFVATSSHSRSPQTIWEFVQVFGPCNVCKVCEFVIESSKVVQSLATKLSRLVLYSLKAQETPNQEAQLIVSGLSVIVKPLALRNQVLNESWFKELQKHSSWLSTQLRVVSEKSLGLPYYEQVKSVLDIFPQLTTYSKIERLLEQYGDPETLISVLFDDSSLLASAAIEEKSLSQSKAELAKSAFPSKKKAAQSSHYKDDYKISVLSRQQNHAAIEKDDNAIQTTLRLIYEADDDERDDTYDDAEVNQAEDPASSNLLYKIEKYLWEIYQKTPDNFKRDARKFKIRNEMRKKTEWSDEQIEGWARMLDLSPRRRQMLEDRYMFRGNKPHKGLFGHVKLLAGDNETESAVSSGVSSGQNSDDEEASDMMPSSSSSTRKDPKINSSKKHSESALVDKPAHNNGSSSHKPATSTQNHRHKTANKAKHGNHNRKAGHAKKMNQGMASVG